MTPIETTLNSFLLQYLSMLTGDLQEEQLDLVPVEGLHTARWILAHIASTGDYGLRLLGQKPKCPRTWHVAYGPGSSGLTHPEIKPTKDELLENIREVYQELAKGFESTSLDGLDKPHGLGLLEKTPIQTKGQLISHLMTTHFSMHIGQLSAMRRQMGFPKLF